MSFKLHPVLEELRNMCNTDMKAAATAFAVYMDLAEVKAVWDLQYAFCKELGLIYLMGKDSDTDAERNIYLPLPASYTISPEWLLKVQNILPVKSKGIIMAFKDADSTIVYYNVTDGLSRPNAPEEVQKKKATEESKKFMQTELWKKRKQLYEAAKSAAHENVDSN